MIRVTIHKTLDKRQLRQSPFIFSGFLWLFILFGFIEAFGQSPVTYTSGSGNFVVPAGVKTITVEVWGGGGKGGAVTGGGTQASPGGGGGAYSRSIISVTSGQSIAYSVGSGSTTLGVPGGDSWFVSSSTLMAKGGGSVANGTNLTNGGVGGLSTSGFGDVKYSGGNGANKSGNTSGGGGSSAGTNAIGVNATNATGAIAPSGGGNGGNASIGNSVGNDGGAPGGGGGGARKTGGNTTRVGGNGANGKIVITYEIIVSASNSSVTDVTPTKLYADDESTATITIAVKNAANAAVTNLVEDDFTFDDIGTGTTIDGFQHTGSGIYTFNVRTTTAQTLDIEVLALGISVGFTGDIDFIQPSSTYSTITPSSNSVLANGTSFSTLTIVVKDNNQDVISNLVEGDFDYSGHGNSTVNEFVNEGGGTYTFKVRNTSAQTINIAFTVKDFSIGSSGNITFVSPTVNSGTSDVSVDPTTVLANGFDFSTITAIVKDADDVPFTGLGFGNFIFGNKGDAIIDENSFVNQGAGVYTFEVTNETVETVNISVTAADVNIGNTGNISFIDVLPNPTNSIVDTDLTTVDANGVDIITLEIDLRDNSNSPITDAILSEFSFSGENNATIDNFNNIGGGLYEFDIKNTVAETINVTVTTRTVNIGSTGNLVFSPQIPDAGNSDITRNPTTVNADGTAASTLTITVKDADNIAIQDLVVGDFSFSGEGDAVLSDFTNTG